MFLSIFNINITIVIIKASKPWSGLYHIKMLIVVKSSNRIPYSSLSWQQFFFSLIKAQINALVKLVKLRQNQFVNKLFFMKMLVNTTALKSQMIIILSMIE